MIPQLSQMKQGVDQDRNVFNGLKRVLRDISLLTDDQLAIMHYESWHEAYLRSGKRIDEELAKVEQ